MTLDPYFISHHTQKINSMQMKDLNVKSSTLKNFRKKCKIIS